MIAAARLAFLLTVAVAGATFWMAPRPPMTDLAQHAGQVTLLHGLLAGDSRWQSLIYVNWFTPYLLGTLLATPLSFAMSAAAALKLVLTVSFFGFVAACVALRRRLDGDPRLDWLFIPGFFGYSYGLGFYPYLVAAPIGVLFMVLAHRYAERPSLAGGVLLFAVDVVLFFSHGLVLLFANAAGGLFLLVRRRPFVRLLIDALPYVAIGLCMVTYVLVGMRLEGTASSDFPGAAGWSLNQLNFAALSIGWPEGSLAIYRTVGPLLLLLVVSPFVLGGARLNWRDPEAFVPFLLCVAFWAFAPAWQLFQRYSIFLLPAYAFLFAAPALPVARGLAFRLWLPLLCWVAIGVHAERVLAFGRESASFEEVLAATEPGGRALGAVFDPASPAAGHATAYLHFPMWYQADRNGFVDFSFAGFMQEMVRYRSEKMPAHFGAEWAWRPGTGFDWARDNLSVYRYFFVRSTAPLSPTFFPADRCRPVLLKASGPWSVFENVNCRSDAP